MDAFLHVSSLGSISSVDLLPTVKGLPASCELRSELKARNFQYLVHMAAWGGDVALLTVG